LTANEIKTTDWIKRRPEVGKNVFFFSKELTDGNATMKELLGGKGANFPSPPDSPSPQKSAAITQITTTRIPTAYVTKS